MSNRLKFHVAAENDCISSIAEANGFWWKTVWADPENADLRQLRKDPNVLLAGDQVVIPEKKQKFVAAPTEARHKFKRLGVPAVIRFRLLDGGEPRKHLECTVEIDGTWTRLTTDNEGMLVIPIPPRATRGTLTVHAPTGLERFPLSLGTLDPVSEPSGARQRLINMGFDCAEAGPHSLELALRRFQLARSIEVNGTLDEMTQKELVEAHGS